MRQSTGVSDTDAHFFLAGHASQTVRPSLLLYVPTKHASQLPVLALTNLPLAHAVQNLELGSLVCPSWQGSAPSEGLAQNQFRGHSTQDVNAVPLAYWPPPQSLQAGAVLDADALPTLHAWQAVEPSDDHLPGPHSWHCCTSTLRFTQVWSLKL